MSVKFKNQKQLEVSKDKIVTFEADDFMAVEGLEKSFFKGKIKIVHKIQGEKLIAGKLAKEVKVELVKEENKTRSVKDVN